MQKGNDARMLVYQEKKLTLTMIHSDLLVTNQPIPHHDRTSVSACHYLPIGVEINVKNYDSSN